MPIPVGANAEEKAEIKEWLKGRNKYPSGFCGIKSCEGTKPTNFKGDPLKVCPMWLQCPCECHYRLDQIFEMTGQERVHLPNDDYRPKPSEFVMPEVIFEPPTAVAVEPGDVITPDDTQQPVAANVATPRPPLVERRGSSGVSVKGGLEARVWQAIQKLINTVQAPITPQVIADWQVAEYHIPTPSSGAIREVFIRWEKLGFAEWAQKPNRFVRFTGNGSWEELAEMKAKIKRNKVSAESAARRGIRPSA